MSYLEIYNEQINDLLCPASTMANVRILESKKLGVQLQGVKEEVVISPQQVYALISAGEAQRHVGSTDANKVIVRSGMNMSPPANSNDSCALLGFLAPSTLGLPLGGRRRFAAVVLSWRLGVCHEAAAFVFT